MFVELKTIKRVLYSRNCFARSVLCLKPAPMQAEKCRKVGKQEPENPKNSNGQFEGYRRRVRLSLKGKNPVPVCSPKLSLVGRG